MKSVCILGVTGSIGQNSLDVIARHSDRFQVHSVSARRRWREAAQAATAHRAKFLCITDADAYAEARKNLSAPPFELVWGEDAQNALAADPSVDIVISAIVGAAALRSTLAAVKAGKRVALANKEALVMAGEMVNAAAIESGAEILPVDSEHSAIFQCLGGRRADYVHRLVLTASGGPFRKTPADRFASLTPADALNHPVWSMGAKITIDSATMFNKALEVIEAHFLFGMPYDRIEVLVHPQSIVHSMVEFTDGSVIAQMGLPDMRLPIQLALTWPERIPGNGSRLDLAKTGSLSFESVDESRFPSLRIGREAARLGGTAPAVLNAANETAVARFLKGEVGFQKIFTIVSDVLSRIPHGRADSLDAIFEADRRAREEALII
ncbi:MAG: 1-deoxy-D-xylulose-5-phosphate reductoisomerase [Candidatus Brocadiia bacterium]